MIIVGLKGLLICGIVLQLVLAMPISDGSQKVIKESLLSRTCIAFYHWAYPYAQKLAPKINDLMKNNLVDKAGEENGLKQGAEELQKLAPDKFLNNAVEYKKTAQDQEKKIRKLLKENKLLPGTPTKNAEDIR
ncbi:MAG: hypothetical protein KJ732_05480 [Candidatus Margulisbacteria bacterium]|nr:hypothetical protein [Candidatus Margulisiibacteriota bacterium]